MNKHGRITTRESSSILSTVITSHLRNLKQLKSDREHSINILLSRKIADHYHKVIEQTINMVFRKAALSGRNLQHLFQIARYLICRYSNEYNYSGVVFAGFGEKEIFPCCIPMVLDGVLYNKLKYYRQKEKEPGMIGVESDGSILAFAQKEMAFR
jgi:hypothetical protein